MISLSFHLTFEIKLFSLRLWEDIASNHGFEKLETSRLCFTCFMIFIYIFVIHYHYVILYIFKYISVWFLFVAIYFSYLETLMVRIFIFLKCWLQIFLILKSNNLLMNRSSTRTNPSETSLFKSNKMEKAIFSCIIFAWLHYLFQKKKNVKLLYPVDP